VALTPGEKYLGVDSIKDVKQVGKRAMLLLATEEERKASDTLATINPSAQARIVGGGKVHGTAMFGSVPGVEDRIVAFLEEHVRSGGERPVAASVNGTEYFAIGSTQDIRLDPKERRLFSSVEEARARGLTGPDSPLDGTMIDTAYQQELPPRTVPAPEAGERIEPEPN
jgi:hypothetical protein